MRLYRYRPIERAIEELQNHTFYFSSKQKLNDPLESYVRLYWKGDVAAWHGLLRNYICNLYKTITFYILGNDIHRKCVNSIVVDTEAFSGVKNSGM